MQNICYSNRPNKHAYAVRIILKIAPPSLGSVEFLCFSTYKNFDIFHVGILFILTALRIHCCNSAWDYALRVGLGGE